MSDPVLQLKDGFASESPELQDDVRRLQAALLKAGYDLDADGLFGRGTEDAVKDIQRKNGLSADGIVGPETWGFIEKFIAGEQKVDAPAPAVSELLPGFHGDMGWVHAREGHAGKTYWPGGASGVTLDPGIDLGYADRSLVAAAYKPLLSAAEYAAVTRVLGLKGNSAKTALAGNPVLRGIRISRETADKIFPYAARPYWTAIVKRFPEIGKSSVPGSVQTVMLSLSYNRGAGNRSLGVLALPIQNGEWRNVADIVGAMQQDHKLEGIRKRRRMEAELIRKELSSRSGAQATGRPQPASVARTF